MKIDLRELGYGNFPIEPSINFGKVTANVVKEFQKDNGLIVDGIVDQDALNLIDQLLNTKVEKITETEEIEFETVYENDPTLEIGTEKVKVEDKKR